ncbi:hypothetical protein, partial [Azonexus fungiphilus]|uniref:hypothetical protein n=1 Tax=Azonexus fungiphilus TaxID=146940 RepID=UPI001C2C39D7
MPGLISSLQQGNLLFPSLDLVNGQTPWHWVRGGLRKGSLAVTYFRERGAHYHWRSSVSRSCSGRE